MPARFSASIIVADALCVQGATSCNETTNERLGASAANIGRKSAATASVIGVKLPPLTPAEQGENGAFDNRPPLPQNRGHAVDHIRRLRGLRKIDAGKRARGTTGKT